VRELRDLVAQQHGSAGHFDMKVSGTDDPDEIAALAAAGATWWGRWVEPDPGEVRESILRGPPETVP
jgi:hypothetical protein